MTTLETELQEKIERTKKTLSEVEHKDDSATAECLDELASLFRKTNKLLDAVNAEARAKVIRQKLGSSTLSNSVPVANQEESIAEMRDCPYCAEPIRRTAVLCKHCRSELTPASHGMPTMTTSAVSKNSGEVERAKQLYQQAEGNRAANNLGAESQYKESVRLLEQALGTEDPLVAEVLNSLGMLYLVNKKSYFEARPCFERCILITKKHAGNERIQALALNNLGLTFDCQGQVAEANEIYHQALIVAETHLGSGSELVGLIKKNIANLNGRVSTAQANQEGAAALQGIIAVAVLLYFLSRIFAH